MRARTRRLDRVAYAIDASPVRRHLLREAYEWFRDFGELSDDDHIAYEVVQQALRGGEEAPAMEEAALATRVRKAALAYHERERPAEAWPPTVRGLLFDEALFERPPLQKLARAVIAAEVAWGGSVENPAFGARHGIPMYGSVAVHAQGWYRSLVRPPYETQAKRLFVRLDDLRGRLDQDDPRWFDTQAEVMERFWQTGELPDDALHLDALLVNVELDLLAAHRRGSDVAEAMALLDRMAQAEGDEREELLAAISERASARGLLGR